MGETPTTSISRRETLNRSTPHNPPEGLLHLKQRSIAAGARNFSSHRLPQPLVWTRPVVRELFGEEAMIRGQAVELTGVLQWVRSFAPRIPPG